jgi:Domain of unknown function (DUF6265)
MRPILCVCLAGLAALAGPSARQRPNFTGTWAATSDVPSNMEKAAVPVLGPRFALSLEGNTLVMLRPSSDDTTRGSFILDGGETRVRQPGRTCVGDSISIESAAWEGDAIVFRRLGTIPSGGGAVIPANARGVLRIESPDTLVMALHSAAQGDRPARITGTVYKRSPETIADPVAIPAVPHAAASIADVSWIGTVWTGTTQASTVEERWTPPASGAMLAVARTLRGTQIASFEFLCIAERFGTLVYYAMPNGRAPATPFTLSQLTPDSATFENPQHNFPKVVRYRRLEDGSLETTVSGANNERAQVVVLKPQK